MCPCMCTCKYEDLSPSVVDIVVVLNLGFDSELSEGSMSYHKVLIQWI